MKKKESLSDLWANKFKLGSRLLPRRNLIPRLQWKLLLGMENRYASWPIFTCKEKTIRICMLSLGMMRIAGKLWGSKLATVSVPDPFYLLLKPCRNFSKESEFHYKFSKPTERNPLSWCRAHLNVERVVKGPSKLFNFLIFISFLLNECELWPLRVGCWLRGGCVEVTWHE